MCSSIQVFCVGNIHKKNSLRKHSFHKNEHRYYSVVTALFWWELWSAVLDVVRPKLYGTLVKCWTVFTPIILVVSETMSWDWGKLLNCHLRICKMTPKKWCASQLRNVGKRRNGSPSSILLWFNCCYITVHLGQFGTFNLVGSCYKTLL